MKHLKISLIGTVMAGVLIYGCTVKKDAGKDSGAAGKSGEDGPVSSAGESSGDAPGAAGMPSSTDGGTGPSSADDGGASSGGASGASSNEGGESSAAGASSMETESGTCTSPETHFAEGTVVWKQDFEGDAADWSIGGGVWAVGKPTNGAGPKPFAGQQVAGTGLSADYENSKNAFLISPKIDVPAAKNLPRFRFKYWYELASGDTAYVLVRVDGGSWLTAMTITQSGDGAWRQGLLDLSSYANRSVEIGFELYTNSAATAPGFFIDDAAFETGAHESESQQGFEGSWDDWSAANGVWELGSPTSPNAPKPVEGKAVVGTMLGADYQNGINATLISPPIDVPSAQAFPHVSFRYWYELAGGDTGYVLLRADGGSWNTLMTLTGSGDAQWFNADVNLSAWADRTVELGFQLYTNSAATGPGFYLDDYHYQTCAPELKGLQDFEHGWAGWSAWGGVWAVGEPTASDGPKPHGGKAVAGTVLSGDYEAGHNAFLVSPRVVVPKDATAPGISYWNWYDLAAGDTGYALIRVDGGSWLTLDTLTGSGSNAWRQQRIDLATYKGHTIELGFELYTNSAANSLGYYVDDVSFNLQ